MEGEKYIKYNPGLVVFIEKSLEKNYIVSGGLKEFLENLKIAKYFCDIYGTPIKQNQNGIYGIGDVMTIFVYQSDRNDIFYDYNNEIYNALNEEEIVDFCCIADYREGSELSNILQRQ